MGFTTGFLGGVTLTYSVLYLTIYIHKANRNIQHTILQQSNGVLNSVVEPPQPVPDPPPYEIRRAGLTEQLKDGWNREVERLVKNIQTTDWTRQREIYEQKIAAAWSGVRQTEQVQELEQKVKEGVKSAKATAVEAAETGKVKAREAAESARQKARDIKNTPTEEMKEKLVGAKEVVKEKLRPVTDTAKEKLGVAKDVAREKTGQKRLLEL
ncbi:uncharacterized protein AB675_159 [Cyphellophora attinorum]|uniref:MICOS complex subunit MIC12 n=1 Tax=Cyphellophora attinorum TaxID=1664694 RepID=A0A0N1NXX2_9EURO|nr:uncharacterized protein AB675_159 [Phialophora attinorum]KPI37725.1 hypothetical protein AB675_159 [Phialophora attinorum]